MKWLIGLLGVLFFNTVLAGDAECRFVGHNQDAVIIGTILKKNPDSYTVEISDTVSRSSAQLQHVKSGYYQPPKSKIITLDRFNHYAFLRDRQPKTGDYILASIGRGKGGRYHNEWGIFLVDRLDKKTLSITMPEPKAKTEHLGLRALPLLAMQDLVPAEPEIDTSDWVDRIKPMIENFVHTDGKRGDDLDSIRRKYGC